MRLHFVDYLSARVSSKEGRKLSLVLHRRLALTALVAPATFLPGVHGVIAAEVAAPGPESRGRRWCARSGATIWTAAAPRPQLHKLSCSYSPPALLHSHCLPFIDLDESTYVESSIFSLWDCPPVKSWEIPERF